MMKPQGRRLRLRCHRQERCAPS